MRSRTDSLPPGLDLAGYRIERVLGQGGFGITYLAHDARLERRVAIKEYFPGQFAARAEDTTVEPRTDAHADTFHRGLQGFLAEARTMARFRHPAIVPVLAVFQAHGTAYMVMAYEEGESLARAMRDGRFSGEANLRAMLDPLLEGLQAVHEAGYIHRDIKPDNIYLRTDGTPVLIDFGSARQAVGAGTRALTALVTPGYAPFEQYDGSRDGEQNQGPWTDIYALGAVLYQLVTGRAPADAMQRMNALLEGRDPLLPAAVQASGRYSPELLQAIDAALEVKPTDRPASVREWREILDGLRAPHGRDALQADDVTAAYASLDMDGSGDRPAARSGASGRHWLLVGGLAAATLLAVAAWYTLRPQATLPPPADAAARPPAAMAQGDGAARSD